MTDILTERSTQTVLVYDRPDHYTPSWQLHREEVPLTDEELADSTLHCDRCQRRYLTSLIPDVALRVTEFHSVADDFELVCSWCVELYRRCYECNDLVSNYTYSERYDHYYCDDCWSDDYDMEEPESYFRDFSYGPFPGDEEPGAFIRTTRTVGAEIDRNGSGDLASILPEVGIDSDDCAIEVRTPPAKGRAADQFIGHTIEELAGNGWRVDSSCGMHVHVHFPEGEFIYIQDENYYTKRAGNTAVAKLLALWSAVEDVAFRFDPGRIISGWADPYTGGDFGFRVDKVNEYIAAIESGEQVHLPSGRYMAANTHALSKYHTIEYRLHGATDNRQHALAWVAFIQALTDLSQLIELDTVQALAESNERDAVARRLLAVMQGYDLLTHQAHNTISSILLPNEE